MFFVLIGLVLLIIAVGLVLLIVLTRRSARFGSLVSGSRIYQDSPARPGELLIASSLPLCGKPDYLIQTADGIIPVEYKSRRRAPSVPFPSHVFQLMAYCLLVAEQYGRRPPHGILKYQDREFTIADTAEYEQELRRIVAEMVHLKRTDDPLPFRRRYLCRDCRQELHLNSSSRVCDTLPVAVQSSSVQRALSSRPGAGGVAPAAPVCPCGQSAPLWLRSQYPVCAAWDGGVCSGRCYPRPLELAPLGAVVLTHGTAGCRQRNDSSKRRDVARTYRGKHEWMLIQSLSRSSSRKAFAFPTSTRFRRASARRLRSGLRPLA